MNPPVIELIIALAISSYIIAFAISSGVLAIVNGFTYGRVKLLFLVSLKDCNKFLHDIRRHT
jgi:hypothetical protein